MFVAICSFLLDFNREKELNDSYQELLEKLSNCQKTLSNAHEVMVLFIEMDDCLSMLSEFEVSLYTKLKPFKVLFLFSLALSPA